MAKKGENIYKRKDGRYEGRYIKEYDINGKPLWGYVYGKTYSDVKDRLNKCKAGILNEKKNAPSSETLASWLEAWISSLRQIKESTRMMYRSMLKNHISPGIGKIPLKKINSDIIQAFIDDEAEKYAAKTVHSVFSMLRLGLSEAQKRGYVDAVIYSEIRLPRVKGKEVRVLSVSEQERIEGAIANSGNRYDIGILLCLYTGIRIGELCALTWENVDLNNGVIHIEKTVQRIEDKSGANKTKINFAAPKSLSSVRTIPIPHFLVTELKKYSRTNGYILRDNGDFTDTRNVARRFKILLKDAKIASMKFHSLRHTFATRALELGFDPKTLSEILGHSSVTITLNLYAHSLPEHKRMEMEKFDALFNSPSNRAV